MSSDRTKQICLWMTIYIYIIISRKSSKHLHATYQHWTAVGSHQQCKPWSPPPEIEPTTTVCRSRNSTTYQRCRINKSGWQCATTWHNVSWRCIFPTEDTATSGATSSQVGVMNPHNVNLVGRNIYSIYIIVIHRQTVSFYQNSSVWLDTQDVRSRNRNPSNFYVRLSFSPPATKRTMLAKGIF